MASEAEQVAMRAAVALAAAAAGSTNPNPAVGAVVLDPAGGPVGEGVTQPVGGAHAEVVALRAAGERARGGTLVVTLEPCRHTGRTGPCTAAIAAAGIARVVYAVTDPHDEAVGGAEELRRAGIDAEGGVLAGEATRTLQPWLVAVERHRPHVTWKYAATLDGRTAAADGTSRWITGEAARADVHRERALVDAVVVGIGTVLADDPALTVRAWPTARQPARVVVDSEARTPPTARLLDGAAPTVIAVASDADPDRIGALRAAGADVVPIVRADRGLDLAAVLAALYEREIRIVLVEGGATLAGSFIRGGLVDRVIGFHAPMVLGAGAPVVGDLGRTTLADAGRLELDEVTRIGDDVKVVATMRHSIAEGQSH